ncbi:MAG: hypothetical protein H6850_01235 [Alphaproteobacteria bacterium]|nr:MAG: hypothetical protein H6850_01235 [Alphaproteobacteria bacterium]
MFLFAGNFTFDLLGNFGKGFIKADGSTVKIHPSTAVQESYKDEEGFIGGVGFEAGYQFFSRSTYFCEWNFLSAHGSIHYSYLGRVTGFNWATLHPKDVQGTEKVTLLKGGIEGDLGVTQFRFGKFFNERWSVYGVVNPATLFAGNIAGICSLVFNVGFLGGIGARYRLTDWCSFAGEVRGIKSYYIHPIGAWKNRTCDCKFDSKLSIVRLFFGFHFTK